jgi:hypothetical protein
MLHQSSRISTDPIALERKLIGFAQDSLVAVLRRRRPLRVASQPVFDFFRLHGIGRPPPQLSDDEFHAICEGIDVPFGVVLVPLDCLASQFSDADRPLTKIIGQFDPGPMISLPLLVKRDSVGSPADLLPFWLALNLVPDPPDAASLLSFVNATDLSWSLFGSQKKPSAVSLTKPTPAVSWRVRILCKLLILW